MRKQDMAKKPSFGKKLETVVVIVATFAAGLAFCLMNAPKILAQSPPAAAAPSPSTPTAASPSTPESGTPPLAFEVASIKPNHSADMRTRIMFQPGRFVANGTSLKMLITLAYNVRDFQISAGPSWLGTDKYDIDAKEPDGLAEELSKLSPDQRREKMGLLVQSLLAERFGLKVSRGTKELPVYALVVAKNGPKIQQAKPGDTYPNGIKTPDGRVLGHGGMMGLMPGQLIGQGVPLAILVQSLSQQLGRTVLDQTGLKGNYDFTLKWTPDPSMGGTGGMMVAPPGGGPAPDAPPPPDPNGPSIFTAVQEQLGLKLQSTKGPVEIIVIEHVEKPSED
jgi:uncharacterized protein (TIGR03435 family)